MLANDFIEKAANNDNIKNGGGDRRFCAGKEQRSRKPPCRPFPPELENERNKIKILLRSE